MVHDYSQFEDICGMDTSSYRINACAHVALVGTSGIRPYASDPSILFRNFDTDQDPTTSNVIWSAGTPCSKALESAAHEIGHALGIEHTKLKDISVVGPRSSTTLTCSPTIYDIAAVTALYQSHVPVEP